ncbi:MAG: hypothetical protein EOM68_25690, partial [Spirochaetia bacterium]|nr:hypothetical protein [Spirochaetia bacterium]
MKKREIVLPILLLVVTIFAIPLIISCTNEMEILRVTFDSQGGSAINAVDVAKGLKLDEPASPHKNGYSFAGWYKEREGINAWVFNRDVVDSNMTLFAKWVADSYVITYNTNGATGGAVPTAQTKTHGTDLTVSENTGSLVRTGYTFGGWNAQANG